MKHNACIHEVEVEWPVDPTILIKRDAVIGLGQYPGYWMRSKLLLVEAQGEDGKIISILTNDFERRPREIGDLYRNRWQVELFFKWIKQHLVVKRFYGTGQWAVFSQLWIALIQYLLLVKMRERAAQKASSLLAVYKQIQQHWAEPFTVFLESLRRQGERNSRGRRKNLREAIYALTKWQDEQGETEHLNDLTYDPMM